MHLEGGKAKLPYLRALCGDNIGPHVLTVNRDNFPQKDTAPRRQENEVRAYGPSAIGIPCCCCCCTFSPDTYAIPRIRAKDWPLYQISWHSVATKTQETSLTIKRQFLKLTLHFGRHSMY